MINKNSSPHNSMEGDLPLLVSIPQPAKTLGISTRKLFNLTQAGTIRMPNLDSVNQRQIHQ